MPPESPPSSRHPTASYTADVIDDVIRWFHLVAAAVWIGGSITVGALVPALRAAGSTPEQIRAAARRFGVVAWTAIGVSVITGVIQLARMHIDLEANTRLTIKLALVTAAIVVAYLHQITAARSRPAVRGALEGVSLILALSILGVAVTL